ncbi:hypothetical protein [Sunxiuqinia dokdonensis]|uniref:HPt domain-containing protein n=1 Tax=Sunxiuqinia dokdonensis TaxID=1409788 RepID=A0A0L8V986_9BACT|nr:hypothetical protein [Sunxiuqinia dokdonensis]KOH44918.1 hypothetical protein NC99_22300 [Sunxiuqinia dokdonensis]
MNTKKLTNLRYLEKATGGEVEIMKEFIEMYFEQIPDFRQKLRTYLENKQWRELGNIARMAKSSVLTFGMFNLSKNLSTLHFKTYKECGYDSYVKYVEEFETVTYAADLELKEALHKLSNTHIHLQSK